MGRANRNQKGAWWIGVVITTGGISIHWDRREWKTTRPQAAGIVIAILGGPTVRPISTDGDNTWTGSAEHVWKLPFCILPYINIWFWRRRKFPEGVKPIPVHGYIGGKLAYADEELDQDVWAEPEDRGKYWMVPSASWSDG